MPGTERPSAPGVSLEQLVALNDELLALVATGVPLDEGLLDLGRDMPGRLGALSTSLGEHLNRGATLPQALAAEDLRFPAAYRAVVVAGLRAGRLPVALEGLAGFARGLVELRRVTTLAFAYPWTVVVLAYLLFVFFVVEIAPRFLAAFGSFRLAPGSLLTALAAIGQWAWLWGPSGGVALVAAALFWLRAGRSAGLEGAASLPGVGRLPGVSKMLENARAANFADLLALLMEQEVPFHEAVLLAAEAAGGASVRVAARRVAMAAADGAAPGDSLAQLPLLPPLLGWILSSGQPDAALVRALRNAAESYRRRALLRADVLRLMLPGLTVMTVGMLAALAYGLTLFLPFTRLLERLGEP